MSFRPSKRVLAVMLAFGLVGGSASFVAATASAEGETSYATQLSAIGAQADAELAAQQATIDGLTTERDSAQATVAALESQIATLEAQVADLEADLAASDAHTAALNAQIADMQATIADLEAEVQRLKDTYEPDPDPSPSPTPTPTPEPDPMLVGSSLYRESGETTQEAYDRRCTNFGACPEIVRYYYSGLPSGTWPQFGNSIEVVSFKAPSVSGFASGNYDADMREWLSDIPKDGSRHYIAFYHEPEDNIASGQFTAAAFRNAVTHLQSLADEFDGQGKRIKVGVILMGYTVQNGSGRDVNDYTVPGLQFLGWDIYTSPTDAGDTQNKYGLAATACDNHGVAYCLLTETAPRVATDPSQAVRAEWVHTSTQIARDLGYDGWMYFDSTVGGDFRLTAQVAWDAMGEEIAK